MAPIITVDDIPEGVASLVTPALLEIMVAGANARASRVAPCLEHPSPEQKAEATLILLGSVTRWAQAGSGAYTQQAAGPYQVTADTRQRAGYNLWPSEITQLHDLCGSDGGSAFSVDTAPPEIGASGPHWWGYEAGNWSGPSLNDARPGV